MRDDLGIVVIGRNEGQRLRESLGSVIGAAPVVYVDSGSIDASTEVARSLGASVVELDSSSPFTAARGRNAGVDLLLGAFPTMRFIQFVDGDSALDPGWLEQGLSAMEADARLAVVCGHVRERERDSSIYRRLCDMEWRGRVGEIETSGGIAMMRLEAFRQAGGFNGSIVAGEEGDLCRRLERAGWRVVRIDAPMAEHDGRIATFGRWWKRAMRSGFACATTADVERTRSGFRAMRKPATIAFWSIAVPLVALACLIASIWVRPMLLGVLITMLAYAALFLRIVSRRRRAGDSPTDARLYARFCILAKWAEILGIARYFLSGRRPPSRTAPPVEAPLPQGTHA